MGKSGFLDVNKSTMESKFNKGKLTKEDYEKILKESFENHKDLYKSAKKEEASDKTQTRLLNRSKVVGAELKDMNEGEGAEEPEPVPEQPKAETKKKAEKSPEKSP